MVAMFEEMFRTGSAINTTKLKGGMQVRNLQRGLGEVPVACALTGACGCLYLTAV